MHQQAYPFKKIFMKKKFLFFFGYLIFVLYWGITVFFTVPENYLQIKSLRYEKLFSTLFYQRWSFFAPPPQANERLYFEFVNSSKDTIAIEVLKPLNDRRKKEYLFNTDSSVADYVISSSISGITDFLREGLEEYKFTKCDSISDELCYKNFIENNKYQIQSLDEVKTLQNYGLLIAEKKIDLRKYDKLKFILTSVEITKFADRYEKNVNNVESKIFETLYFNYKTQKWEN